MGDAEAASAQPAEVAGGSFLMVGKTEPITKADRARMVLIREIGCICCPVEGWAYVPAEAHHLLSGGERRGHRYTVGLDRWHHRGEVAPIFDGNIERMTNAHGPSLHHNSKAFHERYGDDEELLQVQDAAIRVVISAHRRGEYLPGHEIARLVRLLHLEVVQHESPNAKAVCR